MKNSQETSVQYIKGVGPSRAKLFSRMGVETIEDLIYFFPRRYEDRTQMTPLSKLKVGEWQTVTGKILSKAGRKSWHTKKHVLEVTIAEGKNRMFAVWFNMPFLEQYFHPGVTVVLYGKVDIYKDRLQMISPEYEAIEDEDDESLSIGRIVPIYPLTKGMTQRSLRRIIKYCLDHHVGTLKDPLPFSLRDKYALENLAKSLISIHFPENLQEQEQAYKRIAFEEFLLFQVSIILRRLSITYKQGISHRITPQFIDRFVHSFPFELTGAQKNVINQMAKDMQAPHPMHRLLQGDVGSGKTLVAFFGCLAAVENGYQSAMMVPTEILARQHYEYIKNMIKGFRDLGDKGFKEAPPNPQILKSLNPNIALLLSTTPKKEKEAIYKGIADGSINLIIGTHAVIQEGLEFKQLSFVVIDEQHKFGVRQRALLPAKGINPDVFIMTATPIPRTLCLTLFGDLDISTLDQMPTGRGKVTTKLFTEEAAQDAYDIVRQKVKEDQPGLPAARLPAGQGRQAYIVYPIIDESEKLELKAAEKMFKDFKKNEFKESRLGLIHGQMKQSEGQQIMEDFKNKKIDILIATTVLEVGVDVPNANVMVIEHADRFGLSQLHQLRGRIGRSQSDAICLLIASPTTPEAKMRLDAILRTTDGFKIAEQDLMIRGPGEFFGRHQHGLNELKVANPATQLDILEVARKEAMALTQADPHLDTQPNRMIKAFIEKRYPTYLAMVKAG